MKQNKINAPGSGSNRRRALYQVDMRVPAVICAVFASLIIIAYALVGDLVPDNRLTLGFILAAIYVVTAGGILASWIIRYRRAQNADRTASELNTGIYDMFRYVIDIPYAVTDADGNIKVINGALQEILGYKTATAALKQSELFGDIPFRNIREQAKNASEYINDAMISSPPHEASNSVPKVTLNDGNVYEIRCYIMHLHGELYYFVIFNDVQKLTDAENRLRDESAVIGYVALDNIQELTQFVRANYREATTAIEKLLTEWALSHNAMLRSYDRDKYIFLMSAKDLQMCIDEKFRILNDVMGVKIGDNSFPLSVSMGIASVKGSMAEREEAAYAALDVAIQRGGNQVAVRSDSESQLIYFGGSHKTIEANTAVTSRVACELLVDKIASAGNVLIMGHANPDFDAIGACVGASRLAECALAASGRRIDVKIVADLHNENFRTIANHLRALPEYDEIFITRDECLDLVRTDTLLIVCDVNNPRIFEAPELLKSGIRDIAVIDHHILLGELPFKPFINYIEPTKSSTCEIVAEMIEQSPWSNAIKKEEANVLLSGIMLDTNNFTRNAGAQTFAITHYLYSCGAHTANAYPFFEDDIEDLRLVTDFESRSRIYRGNIAITWLSTNRVPSPEDRVAAARAADKLLSVKGVEAAFAMVLAQNNTVMISGRSKGKINVQTILEKLDGGGHFDVAGAQVSNATLTSAASQLKDAIDVYFEEKESENQ